LRRASLLSLAGAVTFLCSSAPVRADEGMWTFDNPPSGRLEKTYGFTPSSTWLEKLRLASVRFNDGGSGSFVTPEGLMITNHHVGLGCIQNLSDARNDYVGNGFPLAARAAEKPCPGYEVNVLMGIEDVTARVRGAVEAGADDKQAREARKAAKAQVENECAATTGLRCDVIVLYQGGEYALYKYKKYTDVRLVFAPEQQAAFFGGDPDNFTYPRHDLDVAFFRAYENGRPVKSPAYLPWAAEPVADGELVFVSGNPGSTSRLDTMAQLEFERDVALPENLAFIKRRLGVLRAYSKQGPEQERRAKTAIFGLENGQKALQGRYDALQDAKAMARKAAQEQELRRRIQADAALAATVGDAWEAVAGAQKKAASRAREARYVGFGGSRLLGIAGQIVRYVTEVKKPNEVRLEEYIDSNLSSLTNRLYSTAPIYDDVEEVTLTDQLQDAQEKLGAAHPFVKAALGGRTPAAAARAAVAGSRLEDVAVRKALVEGGPAAVEKSTDTMIVLARALDPLAREVRRFAEDEVEAVVTRAGEKIAEGRFKLLGKTVPPDATFTLRLSYGVVKPYPAEGTIIPARTTFYGLYDRSASQGNRPPWNLPARYEASKSSLDLAKPLNFVHTSDIIGGNSGSPTVNREGEFVGIIFDGNIQSLAWDYFFTEEQGRAVSVDAQGILEALRKVYDAGALADELTRR
jgi:hypothetical protein